MDDHEHEDTVVATVHLEWSDPDPSPQTEVAIYYGCCDGENLVRKADVEENPDLEGFEGMSNNEDLREIKGSLDPSGNGNGADSVMQAYDVSGTRIYHATLNIKKKWFTIQKRTKICVQARVASRRLTGLPRYGPLIPSKETENLSGVAVYLVDAKSFQFNQNSSACALQHHEQMPSKPNVTSATPKAMADYYNDLAAMSAGFAQADMGDAMPDGHQRFTVSGSVAGAGGGQVVDTGDVLPGVKLNCNSMFPGTGGTLQNTLTLGGGLQLERKMAQAINYDTIQEAKDKDNAKLSFFAWFDDPNGMLPTSDKMSGRIATNRRTIFPTSNEIVFYRSTSARLYPFKRPDPLFIDLKPAIARAAANHGPKCSCTSATAHQVERRCGWKLGDFELKVKEQPFNISTQTLISFPGRVWRDNSGSELKTIVVEDKVTSEEAEAGHSYTANQSIQYASGESVPATYKVSPGIYMCQFTPELTMGYIKEAERRMYKTAALEVSEPERRALGEKGTAVCGANETNYYQHPTLDNSGATLVERHVHGLEQKILVMRISGSTQGARVDEKSFQSLGFLAVSDNPDEFQVSLVNGDGTPGNAVLQQDPSGSFTTITPEAQITNLNGRGNTTNATPVEPPSWPAGQWDFDFDFIRLDPESGIARVTYALLPDRKVYSITTEGKEIFAGLNILDPTDANSVAQLVGQQPGSQ